MLRTGIGWHFFYESWTKLHHSRDEASGFSAEGYLRASTGPLAPKFRALIPDADGFDRLDLDKLKESWRARLDQVVAHFNFDDDQKTKAKTALALVEKNAENWFRDPENAQKISKYKMGVERLQQYDFDPPPTSYDRERATDLRKEVDTDRRDLLKTVDGWSATLVGAWTGLAREEQLNLVGPAPAQQSWSRLDLINQLTIYGLLIMGVCLMLGLLTPVAALAAAGFLAMIYLSMPPWPDLPKAAISEGHYLFVNKNLIEMLACLVLASTPNGLWLGLDALLFGWKDRKKNLANSSSTVPTEPVRRT